ncbi:molybdopterin-guanine dinucleotide biosynthesis protein MobB [Desulfovibrio sp. SGI.169]|uniref:molybdopterin-guanine dinucleotide biosynthesis protein MobB n=1 Tax=Desulfovibrio sp. SGI.169 TaxID=3420561 RepID=UPI003D06EA4C
MRAIAISGFKNSGKTTLTALLAAALENLGRRVAVIKRVHHALDLPRSDTGKLRAADRAVAALGDNEAAIFWSGKVGFMDIFTRLSADIVLVEGGKSLAFLPRVLCLHHEREAPDLAPNLAVATYGAVALPPLPAFDQNSLTELARLVDEKAFLLGGLDCGLCGRKNCAGLTGDIVRGAAAPEDCPALTPPSFSLKVNGREVPLNDFTARILEGALRGMLAPLKGMAAGRVEIVLK